MATRHRPTPSPSRKKFPGIWVAIGCLFGVLAITLALAPARWLANYVMHASNERIHLLSPQGTIWNGSAQLKLGAGQGSIDQAVLGGRLQWGFRPSLQGMILSLQAECCLHKPWIWTITSNLQGLRVNMADISPAEPSIWPSALLSGLGTPWNTLELQGILAVTTQRLSAQWDGDHWKMVGLAQLDAVDMTTSLSTLKPVGSYRFTLQGGLSPYLQLSTLKGSLQLQGTGRWVDHKLDFTGEAKAQAEHADALASLLNIIGRREGERVIIKI